MYVSEAEQVQARLKPVRKILDDFDEAIKMTKQLQVDQSSYAIELPKVKEEINLLSQEKAKLSAEVEKAQVEHDALMKDLKEKSQRDQQELKAKHDMMESKLIELERTYRVRMAELDMTHRGQLADLNRQIEESTKRLETIQGGIKAAKAAMEKL